MTLPEDTMPHRGPMTPLGEKQLRKHLLSAVEILVSSGVERPYACFWVAQAVFLKRCSELAGAREGPVVPEGARWQDLLQSADNIPEKIHEAIRRVANGNNDFAGIIPLNISERSGRVTDPGLCRMLEFLDDQPLRDGDIESSAALGRAFEVVLVRGAFLRISEQFFSPESLVQVLARLAEVEDGMSVYDPCAGAGGALFGCALDLARRGGDPESLSLYGEERLPKSVCLSKMTAFLYGIRGDLRVGDVLAEPLHVGEDGVHQFDRIISHPPLSDRRLYEELPLRGRFPVGPSGSPHDLLLLQHIRASLAPAGRAVVVVREGLLWQRGREERLRRLLVDEDAVEAVVLLGSGLLESTNISLCALVLRSPGAEGGPRAGKVLFVDGRNGAHRSAGVDDEGTTLDAIVSTYREFRPREGFSALVETSRLVERDYDLEVTWYTGQAEKRLKEFIEAHDARMLGTIADIVDGGVRLVKAGEATSHPSSRFVRARDISSGVDVEQLDLAVLRDESALLQPWDIVVATLGRSMSTASIIRPDVAELRVQPGRDLIRVRLHEATEEAAEFVAAYLNSGVGQAWIRARQRTGALSTTVNVSAIAATPIPAFDPSIARMSEHVRRVSGRLRELAQEYEASIGDVFGRANAASSLLRVQNPLAQVEAVDRFVSTVGTLSSIVRTAFPFPLALGWRRYEMARAPRARYQAILDLAENLTAYLAILLAADVRGGGGWRRKIAQPLAQRTSSDGGVSFGTWGAVLENAASRPNPLVEDSRIPELWETLVEGGPLMASVDALSKRRNSESHQTGLSDPQLEDELPLAENELGRAFDEVLFLAGYPLRKIDKLVHDPLHDRMTAAFRELRGDHEVVEQRSMLTPVRLGEVLYVMGRGEEPILLDPWMLFEECKCGRLEAFVPHRSRKGDGGEFRSLTTKHKKEVDEGRWSRLGVFLLNKARREEKGHS